MNIDTLLSRLDKVSGEYPKFTSLCPAHDDKTPSLSIGATASGKILMHCHAGCGIGDVLDAIGLSLSDLYQDGRPSSSENKTPSINGTTSNNEDWPHGVSDKVAKEIVDRLKKGNGTYKEGKKHRASLIEVAEWLEGEEIAYNDFQKRIEYKKEPFIDEHTTGLRILLEREERLICSNDTMEKAVAYVARLNAYDPLIQYFDKLTWDGVERISGVLKTALGAEDSEYTKEISKRFLVSAADRATNPGARHRLMLILVGNEEIGKSTFCEDICPDPDWFTDYLPRDLYSVRTVEALQGKFIVESAELVSLKKSEQEAIKAFLSRNVDNARLAYRHNPESISRRCVLIGTTNNETPIPNDAEWTRYWPVTVRLYDKDWLIANRDQIWAESHTMLKAGYQWWKIPESVKQAIIENRDNLREHDAWEDIIANIETATYTEWLDGNGSQDGISDRKQQMDACLRVKGKEHSLETTIYKISRVLDINTERLSMQVQKRIGELLRKYKWERKEVRYGKVTKKVWVRKHVSPTYFLRETGET